MEKITKYYVFEEGYESYGIEGMVQLSVPLNSYEDAEVFKNSYKNKHLYILAKVEK